MSIEIKRRYMGAADELREEYEKRRLAGKAPKKGWREAIRFLEELSLSRAANEARRVSLLVLLVLLAACGGSSRGGGSSPVRPAPAPPPPPAPAPTPEPEPVPAPVPTPAPTKPSVLGIGAHTLGDMQWAQLASLGAVHVRHTLYWERYLRDDRYRDEFDGGIRGSAQRGLKVLVVVHQVPEGATPMGLARFLEKVSLTLPEVESWQIGNEVEFPGSHAAWHRAAYEALKRVDPADPVVTMAFLGNRAHERRALLEFISSGAPFDALVTHAYGWPLDQEVREIGALLRSVTEKPLWITEYGMNRDITPAAIQDWEHDQELQLRAATSAGATIYERMYIYQLQTDERGTGETHGLLRQADGSERPAARWLKGALAP